MRSREGVWAVYTFTADGLVFGRRIWVDATDIDTIREDVRGRKENRNARRWFFFHYYYRWMKNLVTCANILKIFNIGHILVCYRNLLNWSLGLAFPSALPVHLFALPIFHRQKFHLRSMPCVTQERGVEFFVGSFLSKTPWTRNARQTCRVKLFQTLRGNRTVVESGQFAVTRERE